MTVKELLLKEIESLPDSLLADALELLRELKAKNSQTVDREPEKIVSVERSLSTSENSILKYLGKWVGDDLAECFDLVYAARGQAEF